MDQEKQRLQLLATAIATQGFSGGGFLTLQQLSNLSTSSLLPQAQPQIDLAQQWAAAQQTSQWIDQAKMAAAMYGMLGQAGLSGMKPMELPGGADYARALAAAAQTTQNPAMFPTTAATATDVIRKTSVANSFINVDSVDSPAGPSSANPDSVRSVGTPIDLERPMSTIHGSSGTGSSGDVKSEVPTSPLKQPGTSKSSPDGQLPSTSAAFPLELKSELTAASLDDGSSASTPGEWSNFDLRDINDLVNASIADQTNIQDTDWESLLVQPLLAKPLEAKETHKEADFTENFNGLIDDGALSPVQFTPPDSPLRDDPDVPASGLSLYTPVASQIGMMVQQMEAKNTMKGKASTNSMLKLEKLKQLQQLVEEKAAQQIRDSQPSTSAAAPLLPALSLDSAAPRLELNPKPKLTAPKTVQPLSTPSASTSNPPNPLLTLNLPTPALAPPAKSSISPKINGTKKETSPYENFFKQPILRKEFYKKRDSQKKAPSIFVSKKNKAPVYKQKANIFGNRFEEEKKPDPFKDDEYSFTDDEDALGTLIENTKKEHQQKVEAEVQKRASQTAAFPGKNVYVPGVGFAVPKEQTTADLWSHVVPKKRFGVDGTRTGIPPAALLPSNTTIEAITAAVKAPPIILSLSETIKRRKEARKKSNNFCQVEVVADETECPQENGIIAVVDPSDTKPDAIPKLRISRKILERFADGQGSDLENEEPGRKRHHHKHHRKKKKHKYDKYDRYDNEWNEGYRRSERRSSRLYTEPEPEPQHHPIIIIKPPVPPDANAEQKKEPLVLHMTLSKKAIFMQQWQEQENAQKKAQEEQARIEEEQKAPKVINGEDICLSPRTKQAMNQEVKKRLGCFGSAEGYLPKGTFVVYKKDIHRDDCALWRVDNQTMLQKYIPRIDPETRNVTYRNSSTYSGWCEQIAADYATVQVNYIKQTRSEQIIEPVYPLSELFPAIASEMPPEVVETEQVEADGPELDASFLIRDPSHMLLLNYISAMFQHVLSLQYFQEAQEKEDWTVLKPMIEVVKKNLGCMEKLRKVTHWNDRMESCLERYTNITFREPDYNESLCQACEKHPITTVEQFFDFTNYDKETLQPAKQKKSEIENPPPPATEIYVCEKCKAASQLYHKCTHMRYFLFLKCEEKLEILGNKFPDVLPEKIVEKAKVSSRWLAKIIEEYSTLWAHITRNEF
ncbi:unnamed protein product, partial [Mesorhabditis spiculigera]